MSESHIEGTTFLRRPTITIEWPDGSTEKHTLQLETIKLGRQVPEGHIAVPESFGSISREHLAIEPDDGCYAAVDLNSANGVFVNGQRITEATRLNTGDVITIGHAAQGHEVRITYDAGTVAEAAGKVSIAELEALSPGIFLEKAPASGPYLRIRWPHGELAYFPINQDRVLIGRAENADLQFPANMRFVSGHHAEIRHTEVGFVIVDLESTNGTLVNSRPIPPNTQVPLYDEMIIRIGDEQIGISIGMTFFNPAEALPEAGYTRTMAISTRLAQREVTVIGRLDSCDIVLDSPLVSKEHAHVVQVEDTFTLIDQNSTNGTFVNGQRVSQVTLHSGDLIQIAQHLLLFQDGMLTPYQSTGLRLDAVGLSKDVRTRRGKLRILNDVSMTVMPREFIAIVGGSGAGKTTLINALLGVRQADEGEVLLNGQDFYRSYDRFRSQIGFVPQSDILHTSLTIEQALRFAARLRLPNDISRREREDRIARVLDTVEMNSDRLRKTRISNLSGGQRKRVSIAAELLADPKLIFLDEATSGLDPGLEKKMMYTLRRMADEGRTVILITHATANIVQVDQVAFLSQGRLVYYAPPQDTLDFFDVDDFADIYERIDGQGEHWQHVFRENKGEHYQRYVTSRQNTRPRAEQSNAPKDRLGVGGFIRQFGVLSTRALTVLTTDWFTLVLLLLLFPLTAVLQLIIGAPDVLTGNLGILADPVAAALEIAEGYVPFPSTNTFVFVMGLEAVLVGMYVPSNELIKERTVYLRERMVNLRVLPYLMSKVGVFMLFTILQCVSYLIVLSLGIDLPEQGLYFSAPVELFITLFLTMMASVGIGLLVSAVSSNSDMAIYVLVILLFFQFFFAGTVFDLRDNDFEPLSYATATRWSLSAIGVTIDMEQLAESTILCPTLPDNPALQQAGGAIGCFNYPDARDDLMLPYGEENLLRSWIILVGMMLLTLSATALFIKRLDNT